LAFSDFAQGVKLFSKQMDHLVIAIDHLRLQEMQSFFDGFQSLTALGEERTSLHDEKQNSGGKDTDNAEFFDPL